MIITSNGDLVIKMADRQGVCESHRTDTGCSILVTNDSDRWHMMISHPTRLPTWEEVVQIRQELLYRRGNYAILLPGSELYCDHQTKTFHVWEVKKGEL